MAATLEDNKNYILNILNLSLCNRPSRTDLQGLLNYLCESDFFTAPASTKYHSCFEGGLAVHSLNVHKILEGKNTAYSLKLSQDTVAICGLLHDVCKIGFYKKNFKNVLDGKKTNYKGFEVDNWVRKEVWEVDDLYPVGHGEKSVIILNRFVALTDLETVLIRWHMGFTEARENFIYLHEALRKYPALSAMISADIEATFLLESSGG
jgi:hypothetical protein